MPYILCCLVLCPTIVLGGEAMPRQWTSRSGAYRVEAELVAADENVVVLKRASDGKLLTVPLAQLHRLGMALGSTMERCPPPR
jgi:hypothetical protein